MTCTALQHQLHGSTGCSKWQEASWVRRKACTDTWVESATALPGHLCIRPPGIAQRSQVLQPLQALPPVRVCPALPAQPWSKACRERHALHMSLLVWPHLDADVPQVSCPVDSRIQGDFQAPARPALACRSALPGRPRQQQRHGCGAPGAHHKIHRTLLPGAAPQGYTCTGGMSWQEQAYAPVQLSLMSEKACDQQARSHGSQVHSKFHCGGLSKGASQ